MIRLIIKVLAIVASVLAALVAIAFGINRTKTGAKYAPESLKKASKFTDDKVTNAYFAARSAAKIVTDKNVRETIKSTYNDGYKASVTGYTSTRQSREA